MNNSYASLLIAGKQRRVPSKGLREFQRDLANWALYQGIPLRMARQMAATLPRGTYLRLDCSFIFHRESVLTKKGIPKRNDASNRIKALHDGIAELLGVDDCWIWAGSFEKKIATTDVLPESVEVTLSLFTP